MVEWDILNLTNLVWVSGVDECMPRNKTLINTFKDFIEILMADEWNRMWWSI